MKTNRQTSIDLRTFLGAAGTLIFPGLGGCAAVRGGMSTAHDPTGSNVLVMGAGLAGLSAAYELSKSGFGVTVLEARSR